MVASLIPKPQTNGGSGTSCQTVACAGRLIQTGKKLYTHWYLLYMCNYQILSISYYIYIYTSRHPMSQMLSQLGAAQVAATNEQNNWDRWLLYATLVLHRIRRLSAHHLFPYWSLVEKHQDREIRKPQEKTEINRIELKRDPSTLSPLQKLSTANWAVCACPRHYCRQSNRKIA